jgi:hypothetical protein
VEDLPSGQVAALLPPTALGDAGEVGEGENGGVESQESQTYSLMAEGHEQLGNTEVRVHTEGGRR